VHSHVTRILRALPDPCPRLLSLGRRRPRRPPLMPYTTLFRSTGIAMAAALKGGSAEVMRLRLEARELGLMEQELADEAASPPRRDRKSTRLHSSHAKDTSAVFCTREES